MRKALYSGTFDPITLGHLDVIERSAKIFDEVIVAISKNPHKTCLFSLEERLAMVKQEVSHLINVKVVINQGLTVHLAKEMGCQVMIRGVRSTSDYEYEVNIASVNRMLENEIETMFLLSQPQYSSLSSSMVKEIVHFHGDVSQCVSEQVYLKLKEKIEC